MGSPIRHKIIVTASIELSFEKLVTTEQYELLKAGDHLTDVVDESEVYEHAATRGTVEMDWDFAPKRKAARRG